MTFEEWWKDCMGWTEYEPDLREKALAQAAWDYQQKIIDGFKQANNDLAKAAIRPDGYVLVPIEPTEKMIEVVMGRTNYYSSSAAVALYKAMIQAAQEEEL